MTVFVCVDDNFGMMFNNRRQSRDSAVITKVVEMSTHSRLLINSYSEKLFGEYSVTVDDNFMDNACEGDFCFAEKISISKYFEKINRLVLFKWNKIYPADRRLDIQLDKMHLEKTFDFAGTSHDKITCEVWTK